MVFPYPAAGQPDQPGQAPTPLMNGQQALYLLALMAQLAQSAHQAQAPQAQAPQAQAPQAQVDAQAQPQATQPQSQPVSGAMPVAPVASVDFPSLPLGTRGDRHYWFGPLPSSSRNRPMRGPIRSAWSL